MKKTFFFFLFLSGISVSAAAQEIWLRKFGTQKWMRELENQDTTLKAARAQLERYIFDYRYFGSVDTITVPLVFHVMGGGISDADIEAQIARLNSDFFELSHPYTQDSRYQNADAKTAESGLTYLHPADKLEGFAQYAAPPQIRFCRAAFDPAGNPTNGVIVVGGAPSPLPWPLSSAVKQDFSGGSSPWDTKLYCNIWIASLAEGLSGYAQMPGGPVQTDGIVIDPAYFLRTSNNSTEAYLQDYKSGRTLVHLMGSYLGLYELWNESEPCTDDFVEDTPIHNAPNYGKGEYRHASTCDGNPIEMTMNFMDSGADSTMYMFTWGQVMRMQAVLSADGPRGKLNNTAISCTPKDSEGVKTGDSRSTSVTGNFQFNVYPNPNEGTFTIEIFLEEEGYPVNSALQLRMFNTAGLLVWDNKLNIQTGVRLKQQVAVPGLPAGIYTLQVSDTHTVEIRKVIVR